MKTDVFWDVTQCSL